MYTRAIGSEGGMLVAVKKELRPVLIMTPCDTCEQVFVRFTLPSGVSDFLAGVYLPLGIKLAVYESHVESVDQAWRYNELNLGWFVVISICLMLIGQLVIVVLVK